MSPGVPGSGAAGGEPTRPSQPAQDSSARQGVPIHTLVVAAIASGAAAIVTSLFWKGGTIISAAIFSVLVTFLRETLQRPASRIADASKAKLQDTLAPPKPKKPSRPRQWLDGIADWLGSSRKDRVAQSAPYTRVYGGGGVSLRAVLLTAALAFLLAAAVLTTAELAFGGSVSTNRSTTLFGGSSASVQRPSPAVTQSAPTPRTQTAPTGATGTGQATQTGKTSQSTSQPSTGTQQQQRQGGAQSAPAQPNTSP